MSNRHFEGQDHAKWYAKFRPTPPVELVNRLVEFIREKYDGPLHSAVDLGCGNGQCTFRLANEFSSVLGTDISPAQISEAMESCSKLKLKNVKFQASPAETISVSDNSVQLITICEAAHWMDLPKVFNEGKRVLIKGGVFAIIGYHLPIYIPSEEDISKTEAIKQAIEMFIEVTGDFWPKEVKQCMSEYADVNIPFSDFTRERGFAVKQTATIADMLGQIRSYSPYQNYCRAKGDSLGEEFLDSVANRIISILNEGREKPLTSDEAEKYEFAETVNYFVLMARI